MRVKKGQASEKQTLSFDGYSMENASTAYATKQRKAPIHRSIANPPKRFLQNFTHSGTFFGGLSAFGPSLAMAAAACASVSPLNNGAYFCVYISEQSIL